jgi:hypothetical protein
MVTAASPAHAIWGVLGKLGAGAGKAAGAAGKGVAGAAGKGAATGGAAVAGAELATEGALAAKAGALAGQSADDLARASGLGKAVPDEIAAMAYSPGKTLLDVPDLGTHSWLSTPVRQQSRVDADLMVRDYARLLDGKPALGRPVHAVAQPVAKAPRLPSTKPPSQIPWHAVELLARAAHLGHNGAQTELQRICRNQAAKAASSAECRPVAATLGTAATPKPLR